MKTLIVWYRLLALLTHIFFAKWIFDIWGFKLRTFCFLTKINFFANLIYFAYALCIKFHYGTNSKDCDHHQKYVNSLFKFSYSLAIVVLVLYWSLCFFFPTMLGTTEIPVILDLFLHGGNLIVLMLDYFIDLERSEKKNNYINRSFLLKFSLTYMTMLSLLYYFVDIEVYPLVSKMNFMQYLLFCAGGSALFQTGHYIFDLVH
jgi:hypothetical protein